MNGSKTVTVRLFAAARERVGSEEVSIVVSANATVADLRARLVDQHPDLATLFHSAMFAVDRQYASDTDPVADDSEVALIPPVSGG